MSIPVLNPTRDEIVYPSSDGKPMSDNTLQYLWIVKIKENLDHLFADDPDVLVVGDLMWYPVEGDPTIRAAPDTMVAFGRPKGYRSSYLQWNEGNVAPQVVFEILSPSNRAGEMARKFLFYETHGVEEYYLFDPDRNRLNGWRRVDGELLEIDPMHGWTSPRLGVRFEFDGEFRILLPDGRPFDAVPKVFKDRDQAIREKEEEKRAKEQALRAKDRALRAKDEAILAKDEAIRRAEELAKELEALRAKLKDGGG
jgi:Uma2 family endonuclease